MKAALLLVLAFATVFAQNVPSWPNQYTTQATFSIPYFNITIPLVLSYDGVNNRQTFDYYNGMDTYVWRYDLQTLYQVVPRIDTMTCFVSSGIGSGPLLNLLPDLTNWTFVGNVHGNDCWQTSVTDENKTAIYNMYVDSATGNPIRMHLSGYDFLWGSHPDVYILDYISYQTTVNQSAFDQPALCNNGSAQSEAGTLRAKANLGKLAAMIPPKNADDAFHVFMAKHKKFYSSNDEYIMRRNIWNKNQKRIDRHNKKSGASFTLAMNHLADYTDEEIQMLMMPHTPVEMKIAAQAGATFTHTRSENPQIPTSLDWVQKGAVNPPKDQGICGSCWTFGTVGAIEGAWAVKNGALLSLAEQQLVDCAWGPWGSGNSGCDGGFAGPAMQWVINNGGIAFEKDYPYLSEDGWCSAGTKSTVTITGYANVTSGDEQALLEALLLGPVSIAIDAAHPEFEYYSSGVYYNPACQNGIDDLDHEVLLVGFGTEDSQDYWLVKNSWSTNWGDNGYIKMARNRGNNCGIATAANYAIV